jgi:hypothetical protein
MDGEVSIRIKDIKDGFGIARLLRPENSVEPAHARA